MRAKPLLSLEEYERLPDDGNRYELDEGELVLMTFVKNRHSVVQYQIQLRLLDFVRERELGHVCVERPYLLSAHPPTLRAPDISFVTAARLALTRDNEWISGAPELAVEILSPSDRPRQVQRKLAQYLAAGALAVWLVYPEKREVHVHEPGAPVRVLRSGDTIRGAGPLAGFSAPVEAFFADERRG